MNTERAFSIIELFFWASLVLLIISIVSYTFDSLQQDAGVARAESDLEVFSEAIALLQNDTGQSVNHLDAFSCKESSGTNEIYLDMPQAGIESTDSGFPKWNGPYIVDIPKDPWGRRYVFDDDYDCRLGNSVGCEGVPAGLHRVIYSAGLNGSDINVYDQDNIVRTLCLR